MLYVANWGAKSTLSLDVTPTDTTISIPTPNNLLFTPPAGDHVYITVRSGNKFERMKVVDTHLGKLIVERGVDNTTPKSFYAGACVTIEWNPAQLCEYVRNCMDGVPDRCVTPQTVCMDCNTCLEVDASGHIVSINKGTGLC